MIRVTHNRAKCIGCHNCVSVCPEFWQMDADGRATLKNGELAQGLNTRLIPSADSDCMKQAADCCPVNIIKLYS